MPDKKPQTRASEENGQGKSKKKQKKKQTPAKKPKKGGEKKIEAKDPKDLKCRFYEEKSPAFGDVVMVKVREVTEKGAAVELLEYNNLRGVIE